MLEDVIKVWGGHEVTALDVYRDMFKFGEGYLQNENEEKGGYKANPIAYWRNEGKEHGHYRVMFEDTFEETLKELQEADFCILNGLSYFGRKNVQEHASKMFAMIFDLDGVTDKTLNAFLNGAYEVDAYPIPNYIILSGHGVHLYYLFEDPIPLFPNLKIQLKEFKYALTDRLWNAYTSTYKSRQKQGINQGFRVIGGKTKKDAPERRVRAFQLNTHPFTLTQLADYVPDAMKVDEKKLFRESKMSLKEAQKKYPEWYERVVIGKDKSKARWKIVEKVHGDNPYALYDWWKAKVREGAAYNHRYFCIMCLAIYGAKCNVPQEQVEKDAYEFVPFLNSINPAEPFTVSDAESALECYDHRYCTFPIKDIEIISAIPIERNKRNGRNQKLHLARARAVQMVDDPEGEWRNKEGRPVGSGTKEQAVREYMEAHPEASVSEIAKALGMSRTTVYKYKDKEPVKMEEQIKIDYMVKLPDGTEVMVESEKPLSEYEQERLARLKAYQERMAKIEATEAEKSDIIY